MGHHPAAPGSFLLRLRLTDTTAVDAVIPHITAGTITDVKTITPAADAVAMTDRRSFC